MEASSISTTLNERIVEKVPNKTHYASDLSEGDASGYHVGPWGGHPSAIREILLDTDCLCSVSPGSVGAISK